MRRLLINIILILFLVPSTIFAAERVSLGFLYNSSDSTNLVRRTNGSINVVAPTYFDLSNNGKLIISNEINEKFLAAMKEDNVKITPFLSNHWSRSKGRAALKNKEKLVEQIVAAIEKYDFDGINIDIENLTSADRDNFTEFVKLLRDNLPKGKQLSVCVAANPYSSDDGWQGSYDYSALGEVSDYLFVMTYDEHSIGGAEGPVASADFVELSIQYALRYVDKSKIVIGIPLYGRFWREGADIGGEAIVIGDVDRVVSKFKGKKEYDSRSQTPKATFYVPSDNSIKVNGEVLSEGKYVVWYENEQSIKYKLELVNKYNLKGAGVWALGQEKVEVWKYYKDELNKAFEDELPVGIYEIYEMIQVEAIKPKISINKNCEQVNICRIYFSEENNNDVVEVIPKKIQIDEKKENTSVNVENEKIMIKRRTTKIGFKKTIT